ncbi:Hypothetical protein NTJ_09607 [Nesidiocoris tenuis]|uniref:Uncharacterized protein n=1 Tax=Nesidiocoris tenuis TaxID=355587 RepID=A0ABN7AZP3_9HEMI|nr:Hypothetical protein NTJ_09607 [Nesidiocoris tenuis]
MAGNSRRIQVGDDAPSTEPPGEPLPQGDAPPPHRHLGGYGYWRPALHASSPLSRVETFSGSHSVIVLP